MPSDPVTPATPSTLACILCGGAQLYPGHRYRNHLVHEHGVIFGADFLIQSSVIKQKEMKLPVIKTPSGKLYKSSVEVFSQTSDVFCPKCSDPPAFIKNELNTSSSCFTEIPNLGTSLVDCWLCPLCPMVYKRRYHFDHHIQSAHQLHPEEVSSAWKVSLTEEEFNEKQHQAIVSKVKKEPAREVKGELGHDNLDGRGDKLQWGPRAFSTLFQCKFCAEEFKRDSNLVVHIKLVHKSEPHDLVKGALDQVSQSKLDGCVYQCSVCENKFNTSNSFMRHVKEMHGMSLKQYNQEHGSAEVVSGVFFCKLCSKSLKHTRNVITAHMKMVHQISWQDYQNRMQESPDVDQNESSASQKAIASLDLFECAVCDSKVKYKRQHLDKAHYMDDDVYAAFLKKGHNGDEKTMVEGSICCKICLKLCMDLSKHLKINHKMMTLVQYDFIPQSEEENHPSPTKLKCYFNCDNIFKKEVDLQVHLKFKHPDASQEEISKAKAAALALEHAPSISISCEICDSTLSGRSSFWNHLKKKHQTKIQEYEDKFGKLPTGAASFHCKVCSKSLKYERSGIEGHLKNIHNMTWSFYLSWISEENSGNVQTLPSPVKLVTCKLCNVSVKSLGNHLKNTHCMTMKDYEKINNDNESNSSNQDDSEVKSTSSTKIDIGDKTLKACNKCQCNFPSRRLFIEHCQVVHGMKFKLKSGVSLPPPPVKRKSISQSPESKRIRLDSM